MVRFVLRRFSLRTPVPTALIETGPSLHLVHGLTAWVVVLLTAWVPALRNAANHVAYWTLRRRVEGSFNAAWGRRWWVSDWARPPAPFPRRTRRVEEATMLNVMALEYRGAHRLRLRFNDGAQGEVDRTSAMLVSADLSMFAT